MFNFRKGRGSGSEGGDHRRQEQQRHGESHGSGSEDWGQEWGEDWRGESSRGSAWQRQDTPAGQPPGSWGEQGYGAADMGGRGNPYSDAYGGYQPSARDAGYAQQAQRSRGSERGQREPWGQSGYDAGNREGNFDPGTGGSGRGRERDDARRMQEGRGGRALHWDEGMARDRAQRGGQPAYGGGYFGDSRSGGQSYSGGQRVYRDDAGDRGRSGGASGAARRPVGPKGYRRPDERVHEDVCERLAMDPYVDVSDVSVEVSDGVVMLEGTVQARREKYAIEEIAEAVFGVNEVENRLRVQRNQGTERAGPVAGHLEGADTPPRRTLNKS